VGGSGRPAWKDSPLRPNWLRFASSSIRASFSCLTGRVAHTPSARPGINRVRFAKFRSQSHRHRFSTPEKRKRPGQQRRARRGRRKRLHHTSIVTSGCEIATSEEARSIDRIEEII
jgi:hypothetical protein